VIYDELKITPRSRKRLRVARVRHAKTTREACPQHPIIADCSRIASCKLLSTYIEKMPALIADDGRVHANFLQAERRTGRMSSLNPNLQHPDQRQILGGVFVPPRGRHSPCSRNRLLAIELSLYRSGSLG